MKEQIYYIITRLDSSWEFHFNRRDSSIEVTIITDLQKKPYNRVKHIYRKNKD